MNEDDGSLILVNSPTKRVYLSFSSVSGHWK